MKNLNTFRVESWLGSVFILAFAGFFVGLFFIFMKNFDSELTVNATDQTQVSHIQMSAQERTALSEWIEKNNVTIPPEDSKIYYLLSKYPDRPWLQQ